MTRLYWTGLLFAALAAGCGSDDGQADAARGEAALAAQDFKTAVRCLEAAADKAPTNGTVRLELAEACLRLGELDAADRAANEARALVPDSAEARLVEGEAAFYKKDNVRAKALFSSVAAAATLPAALRAQALVSRAVVEMTLNETVQARVSLYRALRLDRRNPAVWYHLGKLSQNTPGCVAAALMQFEMFSRLAPAGDSRTQDVVRKVIPTLRTALAKASVAVPGATKRDPAASAHLLKEAEEHQRKKNYKLAGKKFEAAYRADPLSFAASLAWARYLEANERTATGVDEALAAYAAAYTQKPTSQATYLAAARLAMRNGRYATADAILLRALAFDPENKTVLDALIEVLAKSGRAKAGERALWQAYRREI